MKFSIYEIVDKFKNETHPDSSLNFSLKYLAFALNSPQSTKKWHQYGFNFAYFILTMIFYYLIIKLFFHLDGDLDLMSKAIASFTAYFQTFLTMFPIAIYRNELRRLLASRQRFWKPDRATEPELQAQLDEVYNTGYRFLCLSYILVCGTGVLFVVKSVLTGELFVETYVPQFPYAFELLMAGQYFYMPVLCSTAFGTNALYVSLCIDSIAQFKLLMYRLTNIDRHKPHQMERLRELIQYHNFLLKFVEEIQGIYSLPLLGQYVMDTGATCMNLFTLTNNFASVSTRLLSAVYICALNLLFSLYCFTATSLSTTMSEIPNSFYFSKWEDGQKEFRNCIPLCLMRAQRDFQVKAGGMMEINRGAVTVVFKTSYSFLLILRNMKE